MDGDLMAEAQPAFCLARQTANRQTHARTHTQKRKKEKTGILLTSISLRASSVSAAAKTWESDGRVGEGGGKRTLGNPSDATKRLEKSKREGPCTGRPRQVEPSWSYEGGVEWGGLAWRRAGEDQSEEETQVAMCPASHVFPLIVLRHGVARVSAARRETEEEACSERWGWKRRRVWGGPG